MPPEANSDSLGQLENGTTSPRRATLDVVRRAFEAVGGEFIDENGGERVSVCAKRNARPRAVKQPPILKNLAATSWRAVATAPDHGSNLRQNALISPFGATRRDAVGLHFVETGMRHFIVAAE
jgi:hypothetical protein